MHFEDTSIEDVFFVFGLLQEQFVVFYKLFDEGGVVEGIILEMVSIILSIALHQLNQLVVDIQ